MKLIRRILVAACVLSLFGCACIPPSESEMAKLPVVRFGEAAPAKDFVLLYPAGTPLPVQASVGGTLMAKPDQATLHVALKRDVYVYRHWISFDGKTWQYGRHAIDGKFEVRLPGTETGSNPGVMGVEFNQK